MKIPASRLILLLIPVVFVVLGIREQHKPEKHFGIRLNVYDEPDPGGVSEPTGGYRNGFLVFIYWASAALTVGLLVRKWIVPVVGEYVGDALFSGGRGTDDIRVKARLLADEGRFPRALALFARASRDFPGDRTIPAGIARIHQEDLDDVSSAIQVLETALSRDWNGADRAWLLIRLADVYHAGARDSGHARELLMRAIATAPGTTEAAAARRMLLEMEDSEPAAESPT